MEESSSSQPARLAAQPKAAVKAGDTGPKTLCHGSKTLGTATYYRKRFPYLASTKRSGFKGFAEHF